MDRLTGMGLFVAAVDEGSLAAAARRFGMSAAMAGKYVAALEAQIGARLLQRTTRRLTLTDIGHGYYPRCKAILESVDEANREASAAHGTVRGVLRVAAPVTFGALHLGGVVARFLNAHPEVNVETVLSDRYVDLLEAGVDVALRIGKLSDPALVTRRIAPCRMVLCASPAFLQRNGTPRNPAALQRVARLAFSDAVSPGDWTLLDTKGRAHTIGGPCRLVANNMQMLVAAALAGSGIAYGPSFAFGELLARGDLVAVLPRYRAADLDLQAVYPSTRLIPLRVRRFVDCLVETFGDDPPWDQGVQAAKSAKPSR
ncbi:LysR family transcriptional regulator [Trinickia dinghuensis]|uniref:LysR family transcriptional regulator n=1 Tax=Trinickia dinghuensis TaxID=2291023 RepID=A0A3D8K1E8_9BURK|nr:LysR family transcriptional regulator [Trinickia dinghuensis]RDU98665.1 LysR family transcriptional regulator [Trinickia dinghuensis]